jgi:hypothetical protein
MFINYLKHSQYNYIIKMSYIIYIILFVLLFPILLQFLLLAIFLLVEFIKIILKWYYKRDIMI